MHLHLGKAAVYLAIGSALAAGCAKEHPPATLTPFTTMVADVHTVAISSRITADSLESPSNGARVNDDIYILDKTSVKVANVASGVIVREFGLAGDGVGEFRQPTSLLALDSGRVAIVDRRRSIISIRDSLGTVINEFAIGDGLFNSIVANNGGHSFLLMGLRPVARGKQSMDVHEFDLAGRHIASYVKTPSAKSVWAVRFGAAFGARVGTQIAVGSLVSNEVRLYEPQTRKMSSIRVAPEWYRAPVWPDAKGDQSIKIVAQQSKEWVEKQTLMDGIFPLTGGRMLVSFRDFSDRGLGSYYFAIADTSGKTLSISERTGVHLLDVRGDTAYWVSRDSTKGTVLGRGVIVVPTSTHQ